MPGFVAGSDTSRSAASSMSSTAAALRVQIREAVEAFGPTGLTCDELEVLFDLRHQTASARCTELARAGRIVDSGRRRATRSGRQARVYVPVL